MRLIIGCVAAYFDRTKPQDAASLAESALQSATKPQFVVQLKLDQADALYESAASKPDTIELYRKIAKAHPEHIVAPQALYNAAFTSLELKKHDLGIEITKTFLDKYPKDSFLADVKYVRAECFLLTQKNEQAATLYKDLIDNHADAGNVSAWQVRYGLSLYLQDKYDDAISFLDDAKSAFKSPAEKAESSFIIGASQFYLNQFSKSIPMLESAVSFENDLKQIDEGLVLLAQAYAKENQKTKATTTLESLIAKHSKSRFIPQANYLCGQYLADEKKHVAAIERFATVLSGDKNKYTPYSLYGKAWAELSNKSTDVAIKDFSQLIADFSEHSLIADGYYGRAVANRKAKKYKAAIDDAAACLKQKPDFANRVSALYEKGMAESALNEFANAAKTFELLVVDFPKNKDAADFRYQLAWAYKSAKQNKQAIESFKQLTVDFPDSLFASEAHFHVAENYYTNAKFDLAVEEYKKAAASKDSEVGEKSKYKLAWSFYQQKEYDDASDAFADQVAKFPKGSLLDSARFMIAECLYQQKKFKLAFAAFKDIKEDIIASTNANATEKALTCLHGAESANKAREYADAVAFVEKLREELKNKTYLAEAMLEQGNGYRGLKELDKAIAAFQEAADLSTSETGARAGFLIGEVFFQQKRFDDAIRQYKLVIYGYGGSRAPEPIKKWQCSSAYETARCHQVQIKDESEAEKRNANISEATKFFTYVVKNHPDDKLAIESKKQIDILTKLK